MPKNLLRRFQWGCCAKKGSVWESPKMPLEPIAADKIQNSGLHPITFERFWRTQNGVGFGTKPADSVHFWRSNNVPHPPPGGWGRQGHPKMIIADFSGDFAPKRGQFGNRQKCRSNPSRLPSSKFLDSTPWCLTDFGGRKTESVLGQNPHTVSIFGSPKTSLVTHGQPGPKTAPQNRRL